MTATGAHQTVIDTLTGAGLPVTVGQTPKAGPVVVVPLPDLQQLDGLCDPPVGSWRFDLLLVPPGPGTREHLLTMVDTCLQALRTLGEVTGTPQPVIYDGGDLDAYTLTVTLED